MNVIEIHHVNRYGIGALKHGHASYFIAINALDKVMVITRINFSSKILNFPPEILGEILRL